MANLSKERRDRMMAKLEELKTLHSDDESIMALNEIENALKEKKFGLVFEEHTEAVDEMLKDNIPVFTADPERRLCKDETLPWNFIIEGDNLQALYLLEKTHRGKVDCIYIDPPYNTGAKDWKYNNNYVDGNDMFRHSKWLSMMQSRLRMAKKLLKENGVLICAIDDNELGNLLVLLEEIFSEKTVTPVAVVHNPSGTQGNNFSANNEYLCFVYNEKIISILPEERPDSEADIRPFINGAKGKAGNYLRTTGAGTFYPIIIKNQKIIGFGDVCASEFHPTSRVEKIGDDYYVYPIDGEGVERKWLFARDTVQTIQQELFVKTDSKSGLPVIFRKKNKINHKTVWTKPEYNAKTYGTMLIDSMLHRDFSFPKSLYAVKEALRCCVDNNKNAIVLDFFAGSGTTMHATNLLNKEDNGSRICILVTNNEISEDEERELLKQGIQKGDEEWEKLGIARFVTWPRNCCAIQGVDIDGNPLSGDYISLSNCPLHMSDGFAANVKYYKCDWISRNSEENNVTELLFNHIREMIELENHIEVDGKNYAIILDEDQADEIEANWIQYDSLKGIYLSKNVLLTTLQNELFYQVPVSVIPDYYFNIELRESGESW